MVLAQVQRRDHDDSAKIGYSPAARTGSWRSARGRQCEVSSGRACASAFIVVIGDRQTKAHEPDGQEHPLVAGTVSSQPGQEDDFRWLGSADQGQLAAASV